MGTARYGRTAVRYLGTRRVRQSDQGVYKNNEFSLTHSLRAQEG
eukprot:SAG31_NODE_29367_length_396_cov_1.023569_2_plen_43_part_01